MNETSDLGQIDRDTFSGMTLSEKATYYQHSGIPYHALVAQQFDREFLDAIGHLATRIRQAAKSRDGMHHLNSLLFHKRAMLYFTQPSTRTFLSFTAACQILGITCNEVRDPTTSSVTKGETRYDPIRMFSSYFDLIIMRSVLTRIAESCAYLMNY